MSEIPTPDAPANGVRDAFTVGFAQERSLIVVLKLGLVAYRHFRDNPCKRTTVRSGCLGFVIRAHLSSHDFVWLTASPPRVGGHSSRVVWLAPPALPSMPR